MFKRVSKTTIVATLAALLLAGIAGCDDWVQAGDFYTPAVEPADFSPYGYDYDMYDLYTEDINP